MYGIHEGQVFEVFVRRETLDAVTLVIRFECKDGMGVLGIRKTDRTDPEPSSVYQEADIEPDSLRAGRFVHVLTNGQRQSYALSRINEDVAKRLPADSWVPLEPLTEYGFRYLVVPEGTLAEANQTPAAAMVAAAPAASVAAAPPKAAPAPVARPKPVASASGAAVPPQTPMAPSLAKAALAKLDRAGAIAHLTTEMAKVSQLQGELLRARGELAKSAMRENNLLALLSKWRES